jgi:hypothetical protein
LTTAPHDDALTIPEPPDATGGLEAAILATGEQLLQSIGAVLDPFAEQAAGPQALARHLGVDKVLTSRVLKATRSGDPIGALHAMPGPEPLRRLVRAAAKRGAKAEAVIEAGAAIGSYETLIRDRLGDRSLLDAILSAWAPEARREFELRRKQAAFKALSQLKGAEARAILATAVLSPSQDAERVDVAWINGLIGVQRLRPGAPVTLATRRLAGAEGGRRPTALDGHPIEDPPSLMLAAFCSEPTPRMRAHRAGEVVHYTMEDGGFGPGSSFDFVFAEVNRGELPRYRAADSTRRSYFFAESTPCARALQFDLLVHDDLYPGSAPELLLYDTAFEGVADVNDPARDVDRLDMLESIEALGQGLVWIRSMDVPRYAQLMGRVFEALGLEAARFRAYRCRIDYPVYGAQVTMALLREVRGE